MISSSRSGQATSQSKAGKLHLLPTASLLLITFACSTLSLHQSRLFSWVCVTTIVLATRVTNCDQTICRGVFGWSAFSQAIVWIALSAEAITCSICRDDLSTLYENHLPKIFPDLTCFSDVPDRVIPWVWGLIVVRVERWVAVLLPGCFVQVQVP